MLNHFNNEPEIRVFAMGDMFLMKFIYGDPASAVSQWLLSGYKCTQNRNAHAQFNARMSKVRIAVEWNFGIVKRLWKISSLSLLTPDFLADSSSPSV
jgi:hypothetical protein